MPKPTPSPVQVLIRVLACAVCRTDLHILDGELAPPTLPHILGHQIVGVVEACGSKVHGWKVGDLVGVPWLGHTCGHCSYCKNHQENLCIHALFTGWTLPGGFAQWCTADFRYIFALPPAPDPRLLAPLLCGGMIGYRALKLAGPAKNIGFYGFGSAAHLLTTLVAAQGGHVYAFTRPGDYAKQEFAKQRGAVWAADAGQQPPVPLDAALIFAPDGALVPQALAAVKKGGVVVCAGIHMSAIPSFPYALLWEERVLRSVANLTRADGIEFLALIKNIPLHSNIHPFPLAQANEAIQALRSGQIEGTVLLDLRIE